MLLLSTQGLFPLAVCLLCPTQTPLCPHPPPPTPPHTHKHTLSPPHSTPSAGLCGPGGGPRLVGRRQRHNRLPHGLLRLRRRRMEQHLSPAAGPARGAALGSGNRCRCARGGGSRAGCDRLRCSISLIGFCFKNKLADFFLLAIPRSAVACCALNFCCYIMATT